MEAQWELFRSKHFASATDTNTVATPLTKVHSTKQQWMKYAAALLLFIGLGGALFWFQGSTHYQTAAGERLRISLADGSSITLTENTQLSVPRTFNWFSRSLSLDGEALFQVAKNPDKAFRIKGPLTHTQVLGTAFRLKATSTQNQLAVSEGKVAYWIPNTADSTVLVKGDAARVEANKITKTSLTAANADSWISGNFTFNRTPLHRVLTIVQDYYAFSLHAPKKLNGLACDFTGNFNGEERDEVLQELALAMNMRFYWNENTLMVEDVTCTPQ